MKRNKDEDKDDGIVSGTIAGPGIVNNNNSAKISNNAASNTSSNSSDANSGSGTAGTVRTTGRVKKPKQVYDPSDNYISRGSRNSLPAPISISAPSPALAATAGLASTSVGANATSSTLSVQQLRAASPAQPANEIASPVVSIINNNNSNSSINNDDPMEGISVSSSAEQQRNYDTCKKCGKSEPKRGSGYKSNFLTCKTCSLKWHFNCLPVTFEVLTNARKRYKCDKCRRCRICASSKSSDPLKEQLMMCSLCANAYHLDCHRPRVPRSKLNDGKWKCHDCDPKYNSIDLDAADGVAITESHSQPLLQSSQSSPPRKMKAGRKKRATSDPAAGGGNAKMMAFGKDETDETAGDGARKSITPQLGVVQRAESIKSSNDDDEETVSPKSNPQSPQPGSNASVEHINIDSSMSSLSNEAKENQDSIAQTGTAALSDGQQQEQQKSVQAWSVEQVVNFIKRFYPRESAVFEAQEIDGAALMVLNRQDIIDRFGLKLGPALRVFELVLLLQTSTDDVTLAWCN